MKSKVSRLAISGMAFACAAFLAACGGGRSTPKITSITIAPTNGEIYVSASAAAAVRGAARRAAGEVAARPAVTIQPVTAACGKLQYTATALYSDKTTKDQTSAVTWSSSNSSAATITSSGSSAGLAVGVGLGTTNIGAALMGVTATTEPLAVDQLNSINVTPASVTQPVGGSQPFTAIGNFTLAAGSSSNLDVSSQATWASSDTTVATIDQTGNATAKAAGSTTITATSCDGVTVGQAVLTVGQPVTTTLVITPAMITISTGTTTLFTAMEKLSNGTLQPPTNPVTWVSDSTNVATIDPNSGIAHGVTPGTSTIVATEIATGFGGTATLTVQAAAARFAYVGNLQGNGTGGALGGGSISGYSVDLTQATPLIQMTGSPFPASNPQQLLLHPSGDLMYYINSSSRILTNFVDSGVNGMAGSMTPSNRTVSTAGAGGVNVGVIDPLGRFIYVLDDGSNPASPTPTIYGYSIAQTQTQSTNGVLTAIPGLTAYTDATLSAPTWVMTDRAGKFLYVINDGNSTISEYSIDQSTGALTPLGTPTIATGDGTNSPLYGTTDVNGHLYVANFGTVNSVSAYKIDTSNTNTAGELTLAGPDTVIATATQTINVITDPTGKFIYVLDQNATSSTSPGQVFAFNLDPSTGLIGSQIGTAQPTGATPLGMAIDPTGALLAIVNNVDNTVSLYTVGSNGGPTPTSPATVAADQLAQFLVFYTAVSDQ